MKALYILKSAYYECDSENEKLVIRYDFTLKDINLAIKELEELENRSCKSCKHHLSDNGNFPLSCMECSLFYGNKWESK